MIVCKTNANLLMCDALKRDNKRPAWCLEPTWMFKQHFRTRGSFDGKSDAHVASEMANKWICWKSAKNTADGLISQLLSQSSQANSCWWGFLSNAYLPNYPSIQKGMLCTFFSGRKRGRRGRVDKRQSKFVNSGISTRIPKRATHAKSWLKQWTATFAEACRENKKFITYHVSLRKCST